MNSNVDYNDDDCGDDDGESARSSLACKKIVVRAAE